MYVLQNFIRYEGNVFSTTSVAGKSVASAQNQFGQEIKYSSDVINITACS